RFVFVEQFVFGNLVLPVVLLTQLVLVGRFVFGNLVLLVPLVAVEEFVFVNLVARAVRVAGASRLG
ncbi:hypothetical protein PF004_g31352, partial [Phytophthora fragariae]